MTDRVHGSEDSCLLIYLVSMATIKCIAPPLCLQCCGNSYYCTGGNDY